MTAAQQQPGDQQPQAPVYRPWLHRYAMLTVAATFCLIVLGGTVTSREAGLAVPDWPTTFGYNMYLVPLDMWVGRGNVFWEHSHRLLGSVIGVLTIGITLWLLATQRHRRWLCGLGFGVLLLVIVQGIMGGLRVTELSTTLAVIHGVTAQLFFCLMILIAASTSRLWLNHTTAVSRGQALEKASTDRVRLAKLPALILLGVMVVQLILGATTRHNSAGLAIPDFPTAYGGVVPPLTQEGITAALDDMPYDQVPGYDYTPGQVGVHFAHRLWALVVVAAAVWVMVRLGPALREHRSLAVPAGLYMLLLLSQIKLGMLVIWTQRHPEVATAHQTIGAVMLGLATLLVIRIRLLGWSNIRAALPSKTQAACGSVRLGGAGI